MIGIEKNASNKPLFSLHIFRKFEPRIFLENGKEELISSELAPT